VRDRFNELGLAALVSAGQIRVRQTYDGEPDPAYNQPPGTRSQAIEYFDIQTNELLARIHRYRRPGYQSTQPDPKSILDECPHGEHQAEAKYPTQHCAKEPE